METHTKKYIYIQNVKERKEKREEGNPRSCPNQVLKEPPNHKHQKNKNVAILNNRDDACFKTQKKKKKNT